MIGRFLVERRERALAAWVEAHDRSLTAVHEYASKPPGGGRYQAASTSLEDVDRARRVLRRADVLLDLWTFGGRL